MVTIASALMTTLCGAADAAPPIAQAATELPSTFDIVYPLTLLAILALLIPVGMLGVNFIASRWAVGFHNANAGREEPVESGLSSIMGGAGDRFDVKFYLIAMLFLVFDIEVAFLYPWAIRFAQGGWEMVGLLVVFLLLLEVGYLYLYKKGAFDWDR